MKIDLKKRLLNIRQVVLKGYSLLINKVTVRPPKRGIQDIKTWRNAMQQAEGYSQQRKSIYDLYKELLLDGYLTAVMERRVEQITNTDLAFVEEDGKVNEEITKLVDTTYFETLLTEIMNAKFWGHSLIELVWTTNPDKQNRTFLIPRKHVKPRWSIVTEEEFGLEGYDYTKPPFKHKVIEIGGAEDLGLFLGVAQYVIYKKGNFGDWAEFAQIFGIPFRHATYNNEQARKALEEGLEDAGSAGYMITPEGSDLKFLNGNASGQGAEVFRFLRQACNEEIAYKILGNTMTTSESRSSGYAQSKTHADSEKGKVKSDRKFVLRILNEQLIPYLKKQGFPVGNGKWQFQDEDNTPLTERIDVDLKVSEKIAIDDEYWYKTYGIPKPKNATQKKDDLPPESQPPKNAAKKKANKQLTLSALYDHVHGTSCQCGNCLNLNARDVKFKPISGRLEQALIKAIKGGNYNLNANLHRNYYQRLRSFARAGFGRSLTNPRDWTDFELQQGILRNLSQFAAAKQNKLIAELRNSYVSNPKNFDRNGKAIVSRYNRLYFRTELQTIEAAANTAEQWRGFVEDADLYPNLEFSTVGDDRVRPAHAALDGAVYPINDPFWDTHTPPLDWNCRCILLSSDKATKSAPTQTIRAGLGGNPYKDKALVRFDHPYFPNDQFLRRELFSFAEDFRADIEVAGIQKMARKQTIPPLNGRDIKLSEADMKAIINNVSENPDLRNALLGALSVAIDQLTIAGVEPATAYLIYELSLLDNAFQFYFKDADGTLELKDLIGLWVD